MRIVALFTLAIVALSTGTPAASAANFGNYRFPVRFCQSIRFDEQRYKPFVETHALSLQENAELARDPVSRETIRRMKADKWGRNIINGQKARCSGVSTYND